MCLGEMPLGGYPPKPAPNYCPRHPKFDMGRGRVDLYGFWRYDRRCEHCIVDVIRNIPEFFSQHPYLLNEGVPQPDPNTIQIVLDVLDEKLGIR
jgi:hypothetical protein